MNKFAKETITSILQTEAAWDKDTRELRYKYVIHTYWNAREAFLFDEIFFPRMARAMRLMYKMKIFPESAWERNVSVGMNDEIPAEYWLTDPGISDDVMQRFSGPLYSKQDGTFRHTYFGAICDSDDYYLEEPTEEEILALGIRPSLVPAEERNGVMQKSLF